MGVGYRPCMRLTALHDLLSHPGPFLTISTEVGRPTEDARQQLEARWTTIRHQLEREGVGQPVIDEISARLHEPPPVAGPARRTLVVTDGEVAFDEIQAGGTRWPDLVEVAPLPELSPWAAAADRIIPFALVRADREGADLTFHAGLPTGEWEDVTVEGEDFYLTKVPDGDWAQKQFQNTAENTWRRNAQEVADAVREGIGRHRSRVVVLAGEVRACAEVERAMEGLPVPVVHVEAGGRHPGDSEHALWTEVRRVLDEAEAREEQEVVERLEQATGQGGGAARGLDDVLDAFVRGQVERLVIDLDAAREMSVDPSSHSGLPVDHKGTQPADRVLLAAAAATDAEVTVMPREAVGGDGIAALLRWEQ